MTLDPTLLLQAAAAAAGEQQYPKGALYVVATPLGNLADITLRAVHLLSLADLVACEDTRVTARLLTHFGLHKPLLAVHEHNEGQQAAEVIAALQGGARVAYVSDAGTPGVSDPGARLVAAVQAAGLVAVPIPGVSAATAAFSVAADVAAQGFRFAGFLPHKGQARRAALELGLADRDACILYESPHRIEQLASELAELAPARMLTLCRELTKQFECVVTMPAAELAAWLAADANRLRGEFVVVLHAPVDVPQQAGAHDHLLQTLLAALPLKQAVALAGELCGAPRNELYKRALELKQLGSS